MKQGDILAACEAYLAKQDPNQAECQELLEALFAYTQKLERQQNRLVKLSDASEAKLTSANETLGKLTANLSRFVPDTVVKALLADNQDAVTHTSRQEITVFFSDIVGFTALTEQLEPEKLAQIMADYFTEMAHICHEWGGTLDQFIGDAIVIFFGAPDSAGTQEDAKRAVFMARDMQMAMTKLRDKWASEGFTKSFHIRMGLSTGYCNVGNFGSQERLHYTALGNAMNEAARIQALAAAGDILLAEETYLLIRQQVRCAQDKQVQLKGRANQTILYRVLPTDDEDSTPLITRQQEGFSLYLKTDDITDKDSAVSELEKALALLKKD